MPETPTCSSCSQHLTEASVGGGGLVAWFCPFCEALYPESGIKINHETKSRFE
jgi:hypothetical protein